MRKSERERERRGGDADGKAGRKEGRETSEGMNEVDERAESLQGNS